LPASECSRRSSNAVPVNKTETYLFYTDNGLYGGGVSHQDPDTLLARLSSRDSFVERDHAGSSNSSDTYNSGFDIFWRPLSNLQLTATVNPDFGNVESDRVDVNLSSFESFFSEKRAFFLEGQEIFNTSPRAGQQAGTTTSLIYTTRIGSPPRGTGIANLELPLVEKTSPVNFSAQPKLLVKMVTGDTAS